MTYKELKEEITRLKTALAELEEKVEALPNRVGGVFKPKYGQTYRFIAPQGTIYSALWCNNSMNNNHYAIGNCFPTEQAAEDAVRVLKLIQKARESQDGYAPDWYNREEAKYHLCFNEGDINVSVFFTMDIDPTLGYWRDRSECEQFIDENREDLIWFFTEYRR